MELDYFTCAVLYQNETYLGNPFRAPDTNNKAFPLNSNIINKVESLVVKAGCVLTVQERGKSIAIEINFPSLILLWHLYLHTLE